MRPPRSTRPRTRTRPAHADAVDATVLAVDRGRYSCQVADRRVTAMRARELGRGSVVVGDRVALVGDTSGALDTLARIVRIAARTSVLRRSADDADPVERVIVANADLLVIVSSLAEPPPRWRFIDRCLVAAYDGRLDPLLCLTKRDLAEPDELAAAYAPLGVPAIATGPGDADAGVARIADLIAGRRSVLVGHSGVGKSTLVNRLVPAADRSTGAVNVVTGRGRHTSSSAVALSLPEGGWVADTPGVRSFGLAHVQPADVLAAFPDLAEAAEDCLPGCQHAAGWPGCALDAAAEAGRVTPARVDSLRRLLASRGPSGDGD